MFDPYHDVPSDYDSFTRPTPTGTGAHLRPDGHLYPNAVALTWADTITYPGLGYWEKDLVFINVLADFLADIRQATAASIACLNTGQPLVKPRAFADNPASFTLAHRIIYPSVTASVWEGQCPALVEAPFRLPLETSGANMLLAEAAELEVTYLLACVYRHHRSKGVGWVRRRLTLCDGNGIGIGLTYRQIRQADTYFNRKPDRSPAEATSTHESPNFTLNDARYLVRLLLKEHLNYDAKEGVLAL